MTKPISYDSLYKGVELHVLVVISKTNKLPADVPLDVIHRMETEDLIVQYNLNSDRWGTRPSGRKLLAAATKHLTDAVIARCSHS